MREEVRAEDLHAGDWVERPRPDRGPVPVTVWSRGRPDASGKRRFVTGTNRDPREELLLAQDEMVVLLARWPDLPENYAIKSV